MCLIIDVNTIASVFDPNSHDHSEFKPILDWIVNGKGKVIMGGTKYGKELLRMSKYLKILKEFSKVHKVVRLCDEEVDLVQTELEKDLKHPDFDDPHLIAIVTVSKCRLICSKDYRSFRFIKNPLLYPPGINAPKIYSKFSNKDLLNDTTIVEICEPKKKINKIQREQLSQLVAR